MKQCVSCARWKGESNGSGYSGDCTLKLPPWAMAATDRFARRTDPNETCDFHQWKKED